MRIISFDIASKSLALSIIIFNEKWKDDLENINHSFKNCDPDMGAVEFCKHALAHIDQIENLVDELIVPVLFDVVDLIPGKKVKETTPVLRAARLSAYINMIDDIYLSDVDPTEQQKILLEYQMGPNDKSRCVCSQILYHYSGRSFSEFKTTHKHDASKIISATTTYDIEIVGPSLKNKINLDKVKNLQYFLQKYAKSYDANKKHSVANLLKWTATKKVSHMLENIPKPNLDDIADSVNMTLAWLHIKSGYL
jgi:hypothetical protein